MSKFLYDIRTKELARQTLSELTCVPIHIWQQYAEYESTFNTADELVQNAIREHGKFPANYRDFEFVFTHITTSGNECASIRKNGLLNTRQSYRCADSELKQFLDVHGIRINIQKKVLKYNGESYDISIGKPPRAASEDIRWKLGLKFYDDYSINGFLSMDANQAYGGRIHKRPEVLMNIDQLLNLNLSKEWEKTHIPYQITARTNGRDLICAFDKHLSDRRKTFAYIMDAYMNAFVYSFQPQIVCKLKKCKMISSGNLQISPLEYWNK